MRDNGPVYVIDDGELRIQNWEFDAWGGAFGADVPYARDNAVAAKVAEYLGLPVDDVDIVQGVYTVEHDVMESMTLLMVPVGVPETPTILEAIFS